MATDSGRPLLALTPSPHTPGPPAYAAMGALAFLLVGVLTSAASVVSAPAAESAIELLGSVPGLVPYVTVLVALLGAPLLVIAVVAVHAVCGRIRSQAVHVLAFGLAGAVLPWPVVGVADGSGVASYVVLTITGLCAAVARLAVVPWVPSVRDRRCADGG